MTKWLLEQLGLGEYWTLNVMGVFIVLETLLVLDGIWFLILISDVINDYFNRRRHARTERSAKKVRKAIKEDVPKRDTGRYK